MTHPQISKEPTAFQPKESSPPSKKKDPYWLLHPFFFWYLYIARLSFSWFICFPFFSPICYDIATSTFSWNQLPSKNGSFTFSRLPFLLAAHYSILCFFPKSAGHTQHTAGPKINKNQDRSTHTHTQTIFSGVGDTRHWTLMGKTFLVRPFFWGGGAHIWHCWTHWALEW